MAVASRHLLEAVQATCFQSEWQLYGTDLPAELLKAGARATVLQYLDSVEKVRAEYKIGSRWVWGYRETIFEREARDRKELQDLGKWRSAGFTLAQWKQDVSAGRVPDAWKKDSGPPPQAGSSATPKTLPGPPDQPSLPRKIRFFLSQLQYPLCFQMFGWALAGPVLLRQPRGSVTGLSLRAASWFTAIGALCIAEGVLMLALFWGAFGLVLRVIFQTDCFQAILALAGWMFLWEIGRALRGETSAGRLTLLVRGLLGFLAAYFILQAALTNYQDIAPDVVYFMQVLARPLLWPIPIVVFLGVSWALLRWTKRHASLPQRTKFCLYLAAPILGAQVVTCSWPILAGRHLISQPWAIAALWLNVLLPWLMICGFAAIEKPGASPLATVP